MAATLQARSQRQPADTATATRMGEPGPGPGPGRRRSRVQQQVGGGPPPAARGPAGPRPSPRAPPALGPAAAPGWGAGSEGRIQARQAGGRRLRPGLARAQSSESRLFGPLRRCRGGGGGRGSFRVHARGGRGGGHLELLEPGERTRPARAGDGEPGERLHGVAEAAAPHQQRRRRREGGGARAAGLVLDGHGARGGAGAGQGAGEVADSERDCTVAAGLRTAAVTAAATRSAVVDGRASVWFSIRGAVPAAAFRVATVIAGGAAGSRVPSDHAVVNHRPSQQAPRLVRAAFGAAAAAAAHYQADPQRRQQVRVEPRPEPPPAVGVGPVGAGREVGGGGGEEEELVGDEDVDGAVEVAARGGPSVRMPGVN